MRERVRDRLARVAPWLLLPGLGAAHEDLPGVEHTHAAADWHDVLAGAAVLLVLFGVLALIQRRRKGRRG